MKEAEFRRAVELMARKTSPDGAILVVLDADSDCPAEVGPRLRAWLSSERPDRRGAVVLACPEFETWFLAAGQSLRNRRGLPDDLAPPRDPQAIRGAKEWLDSRMSNGYRETIDQPALAAVFDWRVTHASSPSFERMARAVSSLIGVRVSPGPERP